MSIRASLTSNQILEDYNTQLRHLKTEVDRIQKDYVDWEKDQGSSVPKVKERRNDTQGLPPRFI